MVKVYRSIKLLLVVFILFSGCKTTKTTTSSSSYVDPYEGKKDNELTPTELYIKTYRNIAMEEMQRGHVPASITLAQGILESGNGTSYLSTKGSNHFGIKCGSSWTGDKVYLDDDEENECFRKYKNIEDSYKDHTDFLNKNSRYASLFELEITDYKGWATGLKAAGYATRRNYAELLIDIIEKHELYIYDIGGTKKDVKNEVASTEKAVTTKDQFMMNKLPAVRVKPGDTYQGIANAHGLSVNTLLEYNDIEMVGTLYSGSILYLKPKKTKAKVQYHIVREKDRLHSISQEYGVKLASLYMYNMLEPGDEPEVGEIIYLKGKRREPPAIRNIVEESNKPKIAKTEKTTTKTTETVPDEEHIVINNSNTNEEVEGFEEVPVMTGNKNEPKTNNSEESVSDILGVNNDEEVITIGETKTVTNTPKTSTTAKSNVDFHFVQKGETLFGISKLYNVPVEDIVEWNKLESNTLSVGDTLVIKKSEIGTKTATTNIDRPVVSNESKELTIGHSGNEQTNKVSATDTVFHIVQEGESLFTISRKYETTIVDLISKNRLAEYEVEPGTKLIIELPKVPVYTSPTTTTSSTKTTTTTTKTTVSRSEATTASDATYHLVVKGETLYSISKKYGISVTQLQELNDLKDNSINVGQKLKVSGSKSTSSVKQTKPATGTQKIHVVQVQETLYSISKKYNMTVERLKELNNLNSNAISIGQKLIVE